MTRYVLQQPFFQQLVGKIDDLYIYNYGEETNRAVDRLGSAFEISNETEEK